MHLADVEQAAFEICPKVYTGELDLNSTKSVRQLGYKRSSTPPKPDQVAIVRGTRDQTVMILSSKNFNSEDPFCMIFAAAPNVQNLFDSLSDEAKGRGFIVGKPEPYHSDGARIVAFDSPYVPKQEIFFMEATGGSYNIDSASVLLIAYFPKRDKN